MSRWRAPVRAVVRNPRLMVTASVVIVVGAIIVAERVMAHRYKLGMQWGPDKRFELAPAPTASLP